MSGYLRYPSGDHADYSSYTATPQYTQSQINTYYAQYQQLPPRPYQIIPEIYAPVAVPGTYDTTSSPPGYGSQYGGSVTGMSEPSSLAPPHDEETVRRRRSTKTDRRSRSNSRTRTWTCDFQQCTSTANFTRLADLQRHQSTVHGVGAPAFPCTVPRCTRIGDKGFTRRDHLVEHLRNYHHLDIPKRRAGERSAGLLP
ncbi:hypothetical protein K504DRAFT_446966 [Pleomassaria siparia CBS 279.74]|uniref:C2H2-type domain-containing protein n=1 Tax=Pleomassaria siparia CBS 279.74 TaxID=1314801 RepID=A0A6G1K5S5_9PLEO|nr:hypothetical protein K504DRAFT_446966 [Pleomassaria siparia CBS 279.74]